MILKTRLIYYDATGVIVNSDLTSFNPQITIKRGVEAVNNQAEITLSNPIVDFYSNGVPKRMWVDANGDILFKATKSTYGYENYEERIEIYAKNVSDASENIVSDDNLLFAGQIVSVNVEHQKSQCQVKLIASDRTFNLLNRIASNSYTAKTSPFIIQDVVRYVSESRTREGFNRAGQRGTGDAYPFSIDARLFSQSIKQTATAVNQSLTKTITAPSANFTGNSVAVGDMVRNTSTNQVALVTAINSSTSVTLSKAIFTRNSTDQIEVSDGFIFDYRIDGSAFPSHNFGLANKSAYEWLTTLCQTQYTNAVGASVLLMQRPLTFYVDGKNRLHCFYPDDTPSIEMDTAATSTVGNDTREHKILSVSMEKNLFDIVNFIIFKCGTDMNGRTIRWYAQDPTAGGPIVKDSYRPYVKIAELMKLEDVTAGYITKNSDGTFTYPTSYPMTPAWNSYNTTVANDTQYNQQFRKVAKEKGYAMALREIQQTGQPRWAGKVTVVGEKINVGDLLTLTDAQVGIQRTYLRIKDVTHNINKSGFTTELTLKEDNPYVSQVLTATSN